MNKLYSNTINELKRNTSVSRPHVVILSAGASLAAFLQGDKNGKKLPLMNNFIETVGLQNILNDNGIGWENGSNFEEIYSQLYLNEKHSFITVDDCILL